MRRTLVWSAALSFALLLAANGIVNPGCEAAEMMKLPEPRYSGEMSLEKALLDRRSVREYGGESLSLDELSQLLWAAQGVTAARGYRTAPSAGALYPLEVYVSAGNVQGLSPGVYKYQPAGHGILKVSDGDRRGDISSAALGQSPVRAAPAVIVFSAVYERTTSKYGERGIRYVHMEAGHAAQNVALQAVSLGLGTVVIGAFNDSSVKKVLAMPDREQPLYIIPVGRGK